MNFPDLFTPRSRTITDQQIWQEEFLSEVKDFHTSGKVSASLGIRLFKLPAQTHYDMPNGETINVVRERYSEAREHVDELVGKFY